MDKIRFRWQRGTLKDSLKTSINFDTIEELEAYVDKELFNEKGTYGIDERCHQKLDIVLRNQCPVGFIYIEIDQGIK